MGQVDDVRSDLGHGCCRGFVRFLVHFSLFRELSYGVLFWLYRVLELFTLVLIILVWFGMLVVCFVAVVVLSLLSLLMMVTFFC